MCTKCERSLFRMAQQIQRRLNRRHTSPASWPSAIFNRPMQRLLERQLILDRIWHQIQRAERRGWHLAAGRLRDGLVQEAEALRAHLTEMLQSNAERVVTPIHSLRSLVEELQQLAQEFPTVEFRVKDHTLVAHTDSIVLNDLPFGPFAIELPLKQLPDRLDSSAFRCTALDPHPASSDDAVTHPHVKDGGICTGDATTPIAVALLQGRICDAFCLIRSVLQEYNPRSPYISLENWDGIRCQDCEGTVSRDELYGCEHCGNEVCGDCSRSCDTCEGSYCRSCLERDDVSRRNCCPGCQHTCGNCGRTVDDDSFETETELCPGCHEEKDELDAEEPIPLTPENSHEDNSNESKNNEPIISICHEGVERSESDVISARWPLLPSAASPYPLPDVFSAGVDETPAVSSCG